MSTSDQGEYRCDNEYSTRLVVTKNIMKMSKKNKVVITFQKINNSKLSTSRRIHMTLASIIWGVSQLARVPTDWKKEKFVYHSGGKEEKFDAPPDKFSKFQQLIVFDQEKSCFGRYHSPWHDDFLHST